jgi:2-iminobutanoate/2-iminopropanoate deaminase
MTVEHIWLEGSRPAGHYSPATAFGDLVFVSGQLPIGVEDAAAFDTQSRQALANLFDVLRAAGTTPDRLLKVTVYIAGIEHWPAFNTVYAELMGDARPARAVVPVPELHHGYLVEIEAIAAR